MTTTTLALFIVASIVLAVTPGPTMLLALANGVNAGVRVAAFGIAGASLASALLIGAVAVGLGALLLASEAWFNALRIAGVLYLCWLGIRLWRTRPAAASAESPSLTSAGPAPQQAFARSAWVALSNPKAILFFSAFLPQFVAPEQPQAPQYLVLGLVFIGIDALVMLAYAGAGTRAVKVLSVRGLTAINRFCAIMMFLLATSLVALRRGST